MVEESLGGMLGSLVKRLEADPTGVTLTAEEFQQLNMSEAAAKAIAGKSPAALAALLEFRNTGVAPIQALALQAAQAPDNSSAQKLQSLAETTQAASEKNVPDLAVSQPSRPPFVVEAAEPEAPGKAEWTRRTGAAEEPLAAGAEREAVSARPAVKGRV